MSATKAQKWKVPDMEVLSHLEQLRDEVKRARAVPLSASCMVHRSEILDIIESAMEALPADISRAGEVLSQREALIAQATAHARDLVDRGQAKQAELVSEHEIYRRAVADGDALRASAEAEAQEIRRRADDYVDSKLANFEVVLQRVLATVADGRERLSGRSAYDALPADEGSQSLGPDAGAMTSSGVDENSVPSSDVDHALELDSVSDAEIPQQAQADSLFSNNR
jgi:vacuolar-type H+-ATPase subunit H